MDSHIFSEFVHAAHLNAFMDAARTFECHILVRRTGSSSIAWIGREGYTGKRADMKGKTAKKDVGSYQVAGLVCSPLIHPGSHDDLKKALACWEQSRPLISVPRGDAGFADRSRVEAPTPYVLQNNPRHRHYGCIAWVERGLVAPRYVHGDYDLYAIIPAGRPYCPAVAGITAQPQQMGSTVQSPGGTAAARVQQGVVDLTGPLSFRVASFINARIAEGRSSYVGALMVNHGEQLNIGPDGQTHEAVLAFLARPKNGQVARLLQGPREHADFYRNA